MSMHFDDQPPKQGLYDPAFEKDACGVGFIADLAGTPSHKTVTDAAHILCHLTHRGACGCETETGDGAGMLLGMPDLFMRKVAAEHSVQLPAKGLYSVGIVFFPKGDDAAIKEGKKIIDDAISSHGQKSLLWRKLPVRPNYGKGLGATAAACEPHMEQIFVGAKDGLQHVQFEKLLYVIRRKAYLAGLEKLPKNKSFYFVSLSSRVITYKGMLKSEQVLEYFRDLNDPDFESHVALVHSRFATNTFPGWSRAHPYRYICHNGEINTLCGNKNWQRAREGTISSPDLPELKECCPIIEPEGSDSQTFDNVLELLVMGGRTLPESILMMMPEAWQNNPIMSAEKRAYYKYHSSLIEPWDGPALIAFTDGQVLGATLDRNGLRPCRYYVTRDGRVIGGSEVGVIPVENSNIVSKGRLMPGRMFLIDFAQGRMISDEEYKSSLARKNPYETWLKNQEITMDMLPKVAAQVVPKEQHMALLRAFGYTTETLEMLLQPMAFDAMEGLGSMGNDVPLACISQRPRTLFDYFKQLFAQVTNPPIDPIRESVVMTTECFIGPEHNLLAATEEHCCRLYLPQPTLSPAELAAIIAFTGKGYKSKVLDATFPRSEGQAALVTAVKRLCEEASAAVVAGFAFIILSDRNISQERVNIPALMAVGAVHHHLTRNLQRTRVGIISDSGEPREVHHHCLMAGYGADAVCPYMAYIAIEKLVAEEKLPAEIGVEKLCYNYRKACGKGMLKVMAKMGVSTLASYKGAQVFEAVGIGAEVINLCFRDTPSRIEGVNMEIVARDYLRQHETGFFPREITDVTTHELENPGEYAYRSNPKSEAHINDPAAIAALQDAARTNSRRAFAEFSKQHDAAIRRCTIRGNLEFAFEKATAVPLEEVESAAEIVKRFRTGAMSYGSISIESHSTLAVAMNRMSAKSNTGEGGEAPERFERMANGDSMRSSIKQVASGRFGVSINYLTNADELQIKMAQGAKPGEGGELPGTKVNKTIARCRGSTPGVGLISPPPHHDIYSIEDLAQLIFDLKNANRGADVSVKLVSEVGVGVVAAGVAKAKADHILISGHDGGTGASRWTGIKHAGLPFELGIAETHQTLVLNGLRGRVSLETDGCLRNGRDVAIAACLGAEMFGFATAPLIAVGCIMMRKCHLNTCPVGIATQDEELRKKFQGTPEHVINYLFLVAEECREIMAKLGVRSIPELVGRCELLRPNEAALKSDPKFALLNFAPLILPAKELRGTVLNVRDRDAWLKENHKIQAQDHGLDASVPSGVRALDHHIITSVLAAVNGIPFAAHGEFPLEHHLATSRLVGGVTGLFSDDGDARTFHEAVRRIRKMGAHVEVDIPVVGNMNRAVGTIMSNEIAKLLGEDSTAFGPNPIRDGSIVLRCRGHAGQSFGAFLAKGIDIRLEGDTNDYCGKGLSGGQITVFPPKDAYFKAEENIIVGNVCLYGATGGRFFARGIAAERFAVRNSGAWAVVEGTGDHGCEYMTGGRVVVLGRIGLNFAAGMSGGRAYIFDPLSEALGRCTKEEDPKKEYGPVTDPEYVAELKGLIEEHLERTKSTVAATILSKWSESLPKFLLVFPLDFKKAIETERKNAAAASAADPVGKLTADEKELIGVNPAPDASAKAKDLEDLVGKKQDRPIVVDKPRKVRGFIEYERGAAPYRDATDRMKDFVEIYVPRDESKLRTQGARCMNCGVPFCHQNATGCPLGNKIPEWNELVYEGHWRAALQRLLMTNNFPEFTGRVCPAPCEGACVLGIIEQPVTIKNIECAIIDKAFEEGWIVPTPPQTRTGKKVAIVGSGPAGLAAADQLNKAGHLVTVFERADRVGGLMMYGVPNMKADKQDVVQRRADLMAKEGITFKTGAAGNIGARPHPLGEGLVAGDGAAPSGAELLRDFDAVCVATGATVARDMGIPGREFKGIHLAMEFLHRNTKSLLDSKAVGNNWREASGGVAGGGIDAKGKRVIVIGGGDTGNDCIGTAMRHGAVSVVNFEVLPKPPAGRAADNPWPQWPRIYRVDYGHKEVEAKYGSDPREFLISSKRFVGDDKGNVTGIETVRVEWVKDDKGAWVMKEVAGSEKVFPCDLVFLSMGFLGPEKTLIEQLGLAADPRGNVAAEFGAHKTSVDKVFAAGDCRRGQSLVVWAIREGREAAREIDRFLMGGTLLP